MSTIEHSERSTAATRSGLAVEDGHIFHRLFERMYSEGDLSVAQELVDAEFRSQCTGTGKDYHGVSGLKAHAARLRATFPELTLEVDEVHRIHDGFAASLTATGRFERAFGGIQPSCQMGPAGAEPRGPRVTIAGRVEGTMTDGRLSELDFDWNVEALRAQS